MAENISICLIGPVSSGKTSLLATIKDALDDSSHGYAPTDRFVLTETPPPDGSGSSRDAGSGFNRLKFSDGEFYKLRRRFITNDLEATLGDRTYQYRLNLKLSRDGSQGPSPSRDIDLTIVDAGGEVMLRSGRSSETSETAMVGKARHDFLDLMADADAIVLVLTAAIPESPPWKGDFIDIVNAIAASSPRRLQRFVVAFNQYERLFVRFGGSAFQFATVPGVAHHILREAYGRADWLQPLTHLQQSGIKVAYVPTSTYGFVRKFGNPNLTLANDEMERFEGGSDGNPDLAAALWRPFCSADPFLFAATGELTRLMLTADDLEGGRRYEPPPPPPRQAPEHPDQPAPRAEQQTPAKPPERAGWLRRLGRRAANTFNVNDDS